jgi:hypothetical protein
VDLGGDLTTEGVCDTPHKESGLNMDNLDETSPVEVEAYLSHLLSNRGPIYEITSSLVWCDERPDLPTAARLCLRRRGDGGRHWHRVFK